MFVVMKKNLPHFDESRREIETGARRNIGISAIGGIWSLQGQPGTADALL